MAVGGKLKIAAAALDDETIEPGTLVVRGRYEIVTRLGRGGYSTVYLAKSREGEIALKILAREYHGNTQAEARFANETTVARSLSDVDGVVRIVDRGEMEELEQRPYMAMLFAGGPTLAARLIQTTFTVSDACRIVADVARTLAGLHERDVLHRDVKPGNIIIPSDGSRPVLIDFGLALSRGRSTPASPRVTLGDERPGSKHYMAPEQAYGQDSTVAADVYQLAGTLWATLVRKAPLAELSPHDAIRRKCDATAPELSIAGLRDDLPRKLVELVDTGLRRDPCGRPTSAAEFARGLDAIAAEAVGAVPEPKPPAPIPISAKLTQVAPLPSVLIPTTPSRSAPASTPSAASTPAPTTTSVNTRLSIQVRRRWWIGALSIALVICVIGGVAALQRETSSADDLPLHRASTAAPAAEPTPAAQRTSKTPVPAAPRTDEPTLDARSASATHDPQTGVPPVVTPPPEHEPTGKPNPENTRPPRAPRPESDIDCAAIVDEAREASRSLAWAKVYTLTRRRHRRCWRGDNPGYRLLRATASSETRHYAECVRAATGDPKLKRQLTICKSEIDSE